MLLIILSGSSNEIVHFKDVERAKSPGYHMGLTVLVDPQPEDYYYPIISSYGAKVKTG
jgi:hypothetical protein